ncbi:hypothetical protein [Streptomyces sp. NPDC056240]|uniref:hypothetical protein n=1 Tax=Streptomyces sp. NPDC056240 TaxID=3345759 RepID=UPI0035E149B9
MRRPDRGTLRAAGFIALLVTVFLTVNTSVAYAATSASAQGGLLSLGGPAWLRWYPAFPRTRFPLLKLLTKPAQRPSEVYTETVVDDLGLKSMLLAWAFVFGLVLVVRGKHAKGWIHGRVMFTSFSSARVLARARCLAVCGALSGRGGRGGGSVG